MGRIRSYSGTRSAAAWGRDPVEAYGCTEAGLFALQPWANRGLVFLPHLDFLEFIPMDEFARNEADPTYQPRTVLMDEVEVDGIYEVVITNFYGGAYTRYRVGRPDSDKCAAR